MPRPDAREHSERPQTLLYASRISVRKGVEMIVDLSHRLSDLRGRLQIVVAGGPTLWSDYRPLLSRLNREIAVYAGSVAPKQLPELYRAADVVVQPSRYEPFALTVAEALASGVPVVASDEVGAAEGVDPRCCTIFPSGKPDALEAAVRGVLRRMGTVDEAAIRDLARSEAERLFAPQRVADSLISCLAELAPMKLRVQRSLATV
jgi:glycosyltransferase involved in cell wall biosynthesis